MLFEDALGVVIAACSPIFDCGRRPLIEVFFSAGGRPLIEGFSSAGGRPLIDGLSSAGGRPLIDGFSSAGVVIAVCSLISDGGADGK